MTKKSEARMQRDSVKKQAKEQLKDNKCWDELNKIYESARVMLYQHASIHALANNKQLLACLQDLHSTSNSIKILSKDLKDLNDQLTHIYSQHQGKMGGSQNPDEVWKSIEIGQMYAQLMETHTSVLQPTAFKILEDFQFAEQKLASISNQQQIYVNKNNSDIEDGQLAN